MDYNKKIDKEVDDIVRKAKKAGHTKEEIRKIKFFAFLNLISKYLSKDPKLKLYIDGKECEPTSGEFISWTREE